MLISAPTRCMRIALVLAVAARFSAAEVALEGTDSIGAELDQTAHETDVCAPLVDAQAIYASLLPSPTAHLVDKLGSLATSRGWGEGLGWSHDGPLATTLRLIPRVLKTISPSTLVDKLSPSKRARRAGLKISRARREKIETMLALAERAERAGCIEAGAFMGKLRMFPIKGVKQDLAAAFEAYSRVLESAADAESQFFVGFFYATGLGGVQRDQGKATLYYTFAALQGYRPAEMAMAYRHWAGIGVKEDCLLALDWYEEAAHKAYDEYRSGPPGGRTFPFTPTRLSDLAGGVYGPHASWASTGINRLRAATRAYSASSKGESEREILEFYQYHTDRDSFLFTVRLGRLFYLGSVYPLPNAIGHGAEGVGEVPRDYRKAREHFQRAARQLWLTDFDGEGKPVPKRRMSKEQEDVIREPATVAAAFLGRMAMRGEGMKVDYKRAKLWYERAAEMGDREAFNGLGIIFRDGLAGVVDLKRAYAYFSAAAGRDHAEAQVNLAKIHLDRGELPQAQQYLEAAVRNHSPFEAFHLLAQIHALSARSGRAGMCGVSAAWFKLVAEKGNWQDDFVGDADRAWARGEEGNAMLGWWVAAELGYEAGQNNVAFAIERGIGERVEWVRETRDKGADDVGLELWVRSAAQDNVDAMVKVGDHFYHGAVTHGVNISDETRYARAANYYQTAADTQMSAMAYWNLGWMYETGRGVPRDWHLAKRFYDLSLETNLEAYLPACLSLIGLYLRSWWVEVKTRGAVPRLPLFDDEPAETLGTWDQLRALFAPTLWDEMDEAAGGVGGGEGGGEGEFGAEDEYADWSGSGWVAEDGRRLEGDGGGGGAGRGGGGAGGAAGDGQWDEGDWEEFGETAAILSVFMFLGALVWVRRTWIEMARRGQGGGQGQGHGGAQDGAGEHDQRERQRLMEEEEERRRREGEGVPVGWEPPVL